MLRIAGIFLVLVVCEFFLAPTVSAQSFPYFCSSVENCSKKLRNDNIGYYQDPFKKVIVIQSFEYHGDDEAKVPKIYSEQVVNPGLPGASVVTIIQSGSIVDKRGAVDPAYLHVQVEKVEIQEGDSRNSSSVVEKIKSIKVEPGAVECDPSKSTTFQVGGVSYSREELEKAKPVVFRPQFFGGQGSIRNLDEIKPSVELLAVYLKSNPKQRIRLSGHIFAGKDEPTGSGESVWNYRGAYERDLNYYHVLLKIYEHEMTTYRKNVAEYRKGKLAEKPKLPTKPTLQKDIAGTHEYTNGMLMIERAKAIKLLLLEAGVKNEQIDVSMGTAP